MNTFAIWLISFYQRYISPYKGFQCAHAYLHQGDSCSAAVKTIITDQGIIQGYTAIRHRFQRCRDAYENIQRDKQRQEGRKKNIDRSAACVDVCSEVSCNVGVNMCGDGGGKTCDVVPCDCSL